MSDGGPAFPQLGRCAHECFDDNRGRTVIEERLFTSGGMSLRDYFAGQALGGVLASGTMNVPPDQHADTAYRIADAMLKERSKP